MATYDQSVDDLFGLLRELRSLDPALHAELTELAGLAVAAHKSTRDLHRDDQDNGAEPVVFPVLKRRGVT